jgi:hypothetical protein
MVFFDDYNKFHYCVYKFCGTGPPLHTSIVFEEPAGPEACVTSTGKPLLLDLTGPTVAGAKVSILDVAPRLAHFEGTIMIRRVRQELAPEQNAGLAKFAFCQQGKSFALPRIILQGTPFQARSGLRHSCFAHTYMNRRRWFCSELVVAGAAAAHLLDPHDYCANAIYPRDLAYDEHIDISRVYEPVLLWVPECKIVP